MIKAKGKNTNTIYLVLGFVGEAGGPVRAVCVSPVGGKASAIYLQDLDFDSMLLPPVVAPEDFKRRK